MEAQAAKRKIPASLFWMLPGLVFSSYVAVRRAGMAVLYRPACLDDQRVRRDVCYRAGSNDPKHRLDLFLPKGSGWPSLVFVHGGGLDAGDKALRVSGADVYGNIGRFYAGRGIGVAVINYRLQPKVTWRDQAHDVAEAVGWVHANLESYGGDTSRLFLGGHSAGAHLATRVALDPEPLARLGFSRKILSGIIAVSGAGLDLGDPVTYQLGAKLHHYEDRFRCGDPTDKWKTEASPVSFAGPGAPPFLILYAEGDPRCLRRQSHLLHEALRRHNIPSELLAVPGQSHKRIVLTLSRPDKTSAPAILRFISNSLYEKALDEADLIDHEHAENDA